MGNNALDDGSTMLYRAIEDSDKSVNEERNAITEVEKAWASLVQRKRVDDLGPMRMEIRESWIRCMGAGLDHRLPAAPTVLSAKNLRETLLANKSFIGAAEHIAPTICSTLAKSIIGFSVEDSRANLLFNCVPPNRTDHRPEINAFPGSAFAESVVGTTSQAIALRLNQPFAIHRCEFFEEFFRRHPWSSCTVPVHATCGSPLGTLTTSFDGEDPLLEAPEVLLEAAAYIERTLRASEESNELRILQEFNRHLISTEEPLIAVCRHGRILAASPSFGVLKGLRSPDLILGMDIADLLRADDHDASTRCVDVPDGPNASELSSVGAKLARTRTIFVRIEQDVLGSLLFVRANSSLSPHSSRHRKLSGGWSTTHTRDSLIGRSPVFARSLKVLTRAAATDFPVLLTGASGTGKELFAQALHTTSKRSAGPFVALNTGALPPELVGSELFGYEEGAFSGAARGGKKGKFELANNGTLFLDEITDMPTAIQASLLRVLETKKVIPLGGESPRSVDFRLVAAMNVSPTVALEKGLLRRDLYHRLSVFEIALPSLADRREDISVLARHLLDKEGFGEVTISESAYARLREYSWPGNVRELLNTLVRAAALCCNKIIDVDDLPIPLNPQLSSSTVLQNVSKDLVEQSLREAKGNVSRAAQLLGIHRTTLHHKIREYGLDRRRV